VLATSDHAHNVFLKLAAERGIPAAVLMLLVIALAVAGGMRTLRKREEPTTCYQLSATHYQLPADSPSELLTICFLVSISGVLLHNLIDYNLQFVGISLPFWMMLGFLGSSSGRLSAKDYLPERLLCIIIAGILLPLTLLCGWQLMQFSLARRAMIDGRTAEALESFASIRLPLFPRDDQLAEAALKMQSDRADAAQKSIDSYFSLNQEDARAWTMLATLQENSGDNNGALWSYRRAFELGRWNDIGITRKLVSLLGNDRAGLDRLRPEVETLLTGFARAINRNSHFIALSPNVEELVALLDLMGRLYPSDALRYQELTKQVEAKSAEVRINTSARPQGILW
jgi:hypothetical protein